MFKLFGKKPLSLLLALLSLNSFNTSLIADECCYLSPCNRFYVGGFGGGLYSNKPKMRQTGTAFFSEAEGGPLAVDARGRSKRNRTGFGGAQIGYEWRQCPFQLGCSDWNLTPAAEIEAFFYHQKNKGDLINPTTRLPEHDFVDSFPMNVGVYLVNGVISLNNCCFQNLSPYVGGGLGAANIHVRKAKSLQVAPPEFGVNHFNAKRSDHDWTFAAQAKAGIRFNFCERIHFFGEYRFIYVQSSRFNFGSTVYPAHAPTSTWIVDINDMCYNAFVFGVQFDL